MDKIKYVLFDCWDTIVEFKEKYPFASVDAVYKHIINKDKISFDEICKYDYEFLNDYYKTTLFDVDQTNMFRYLCESLGLKLDCSYEQAGYESAMAFDAPLIPNIKQFISFLKENNIKCSVVSNTIHNYEITKEIITRNFEENPFEKIICSSEYIVKKPDVRIYNLASKIVGIHNENIAFIGDNLYTDILGANNSNMQAFFFNWKNAEVSKEMKSKVKYTEFKSYLDLIKIMKGRI